MDIWYSSTFSLRIIITKHKTKEDDVIQRQTQAGNITTNLKVDLNITLPVFSATEIMTWECYVDESAKGIHNTIFGRYLWT